ncbi:Ig-like domain repeat protein [Methanobrevibacter sp.]
MLLIFVLAVSTSFASESTDDMLATDDIEEDSIEISDESDYDSSKVTELLSSDGNEAESEQVSSAENSILSDGEGTFAELNDVISINTNGTLDLHKDYLKESTYSDDYYITIDKALTIDGHGHVLDAQNNGGIFKVTTSSKLIFKDVIFKRATATAITFTNAATVDFINCKFLQNTRENPGYGHYYGAAIAFNSNLINSRFENVTFKENIIFDWEKYGSVHGAAISIMGRAKNNVFINSLFDSNELHCENVIHQGNHYYDGAGISFLGESENNEFIDVTFSNNCIKATTALTGDPVFRGFAYGAAIYFGENSKNTHFLDCNFTNNRASTGGGAIFFNKNAYGCSFINSTFDNNSVTYDDLNDYYGNLVNASGGAIFIRNSVNSIFNNTQFSNNQARLGGSIYINQGEKNVFVDLNFTGNRAFSQYTRYSGGSYSPFQNPYAGAMYIKALKDSTFESIDFINNNANDGYHDKNVFFGVTAGAVYLYNSRNITFRDILFSGNFAKNYAGAFKGDFIYNVTFENVNFTKNSVASTKDNQGGAVVINSGNDIYFNDVSFDDNSLVSTFSYSKNIVMESKGGAAYIINSNNINFNNVNFTDNLIKADCTSFNLDGHKCMGIVYLGGSNFTFDEVNFINNIVSSPVGSNVGGSAVAGYNAVNGLKFNNVIIKNGSSSGKGAVYLTGTTSNVVFNHTDFENNSAVDGAAIHMAANNVKIVNVTFNNNVASKTGSAVCISGKNYFIDTVKFTNNRIDSSANVAGGVMYLTISDSTLEDVDFIDNDADSASAGAIYATILSNVMFKNINVINNSAYDGGIFVIKSDKNYNYFSSNVTVLESTFANNTIGSNSNTAVIATDSPINITRTSFTDNVGADATITHNYNMYRNNLMVVDDSVFRRNGGNYVIYINNVQAYINDIDFADHNGTNVVYLASSMDSIISNSNFTNNTCYNGAVYSYGYSDNPLVMKNVTFIKNTASESGGAITIYYSGLSLDGGRFKNNNAGENGGSINIQYGSKVEISNVKIEESHAGSNGGAIYVASSCSKFYLENVDVHNCSADGYGGAVYISKNYYQYSITESNFTDNTADIDGGAIYIENNGGIIINDTNFIANNAANTGGAIYSSDSVTLIIDNSIFTRNTASNGSAIDNYGSLTISNSEFENNKANSTSLTIYFNRYSNETNVSYTGGDNYINAIQSSNDITLTNVVYYDYGSNGMVNTNTKPAINTYYKENQKIVLNVYDEDDNLLETIVRYTDSEGKLYLDSVNVGRHHIVAYREDDSYYTYIESYALCIWGDFTILQRLINGLNDNEVLDLTRDYTYTIGVDDITEGIVINKTNITINGNGFKINALFKSRIFELLTNNVKFYNIHFANASGLDGAFIHGIDVNNTEIINCSFENTFNFNINDYYVYPESHTDNDNPVVIGGDIGGDIGGRGSRGSGKIDDGYMPGTDDMPQVIDEANVGSAVYIVGVNLNVENSNFTNIVAHKGGAIYFEGNNTSIINSRFNNTKAGYGGALFIDANDTIIDRCEFFNNIAQLAGGAILALGQSHSIDNSIFTNCYIVEDEMGYFEDIDEMMLSKPDYSEFEGTDQGSDSSTDPIGPIITLGGPGLSNPRIPGIIDPIPIGSSMDFMGGGAIYSEVDDFNISNSQFNSCSAGSKGGAVFADGNGTNIFGSNFTSSRAATGGAVMICANAFNSTIGNCIFDNCAAILNGGAISWYAQNGSLKDSTFKNNHLYVMDMDSFQNDMMAGGGAVFWYGPNSIIDNCAFTNNSVCIASSEYFDAIRQQGDWDDEDFRMFMVDVLKSDYASGGAMLIRGFTINITNCNFTDNSAQSGGAVSITQYNVSPLNKDVVETMIEDMSIEDVSRNINIMGCNFNSNFAQYAGAVLIHGYKNNIFNSNFTDNTALVAGAVNLRGISSVVSNARFKGNAAVIAGALLSGSMELDRNPYWENYILVGYNNTVEDTTFEDNYALSSGSVLWLDECGTIKNSKFTNNQINDPYGQYAPEFIGAYIMEIDEELFNSLSQFFNQLPFNPNLQTAGAIGWYGDYGLIDGSEIEGGNAYMGSAIYWMGWYGTINNSTIKNNKGFDIEMDSSKEYLFVKESVTEQYSEGYSYVNYDSILNQKYEDMRAKVSQDYGTDDILLIKQYYNKTYLYSSQSGIYRFYNVTFNYVFMVGFGESFMGSDSSMGTVFWIGNYGLINDTRFINNTAKIGGALFSNADDLHVYGSEFTANSANKGGAIFLAGESGTVEKSKFTDNKGFSDYGGDSWTNYTYVVIKDSFYSPENTINDGIAYKNIEEIIDNLHGEYKFDNIEFNNHYKATQNPNGGYDYEVYYFFTLLFDVEDSYPVSSAGGAICWYGENALIMDSEFVNNYAFEGGAVYMLGGNGEICNSTFRKNHGSEFNTTVRFEKEKIATYETEFEHYGYSYNLDCEGFVLDNIEDVIDKMLKQYGSQGLRYEGYSYQSTLVGELDDEYGQGTYNVKVTFIFSLLNNEYVMNPAASVGGALYVAGDACSINNCSFIENNGSAGGAIYVNANTLINDSTFENNNAYQSTVINTAEDITTIIEEVAFQRYFERESDALSFINNYAYGHILDLYNEYEADEIRITFKLDGYSMNYYGYISYNLNSIIFNISLINYVDSVKVGSFGGAVYLNTESNLINSSTFKGNKAEYGGAVYIDANYNNIEGTGFSSNVAEYGGAVYVNATYATIEDSLFELNNAYLGGAIYWNGEYGIVNDTRFFNNTAFHAGAIYYKANNQNLNNSIFKYNKADSGSALYVEAKDLTISSSTMLENQAKSYSIDYEYNITDGIIYIHAIFRGNDNFINAIYTLNEITIGDVTYCPIGAGYPPEITNLEDGINISIKLSDYTENILRESSNFTNASGEVIISMPIKEGRYLLTVGHKEDNYYTEMSKSQMILVGFAPTIIRVMPEDIFYKQNETITVHVPVDVTGNVTLEINGKNYTSKEINDGEVIFVIPNLPGGTYNVTAYYEGNNKSLANSTSALFHVKPIETSIVVSTDGGYYGTDIPVNVSIADTDAKGKVLIVIEDIYGSTLVIADSNNLSTVINTLDAGTYNLTAFYTGDNSYLNATDSTILVVTPINLNATGSSENITTDENSTFLINVPDSFVGKANITVGDVTKVYDISGPTRVTFDSLEEGGKTADIKLYGSKNYNDQSFSISFEVRKPISTDGLFTIHSNDMKRGWNSPYDYQAEFLNANGDALANADVKFIVNGKEYIVKTNYDGIAQLRTSKLAIGKYTITSINLATGHQIDNRIEIVARIVDNKDVTMDYMDGTYFTVKVIGDDGKVAPQGDMIDVFINNVHNLVKVGKNGIAKFKINVNPKTYKVVVEYKTFKKTNKIVVKQTLKLVKKTVKVKKGKKIILKAKLKWSNGKAIKGKKITFKFKGKKYKAKTNKKGVAKVVIKKKNVLKKLKRGKKYKFTATYVKNTVKGKVSIKK